MSLQSEEAEARVGCVLNDKWMLERLLGAGGMGAVYAGVHRNGARAAVKVLHRVLSKHDNVRSRFLREGYVSNRVDRLGVVKVLDDDIVKGGNDDGTAYLVMELLSGQSLDQRARTTPLTEREFLAVADAVLDVLEGAFEAGVVHRDIKPENIFLAREESGVQRVKLLDFGLARLLEGPSFTSYGLAIGTPSFMAPEQAAGRNAEIDGRTDLFALAASGFLLLTGRRIHEGLHPNDRVAKMATLPAPRIRTVSANVSMEVARVLDRALEFQREARYENASAMRADVRQALASLGGDVTDLPRVAAHDRTLELSAKDFLRPGDSTSPAGAPRENTLELSAKDFLPPPEPATGARGRTLELDARDFLMPKESVPVLRAAAIAETSPAFPIPATNPQAPVRQSVPAAIAADFPEIRVNSAPPPAVRAVPPTVEMQAWAPPAMPPPAPPIPASAETPKPLRKRSLVVPVVLGVLGLSVGAGLALTLDSASESVPAAAPRGGSAAASGAVDGAAPKPSAAPKKHHHLPK